MFTRSTQKLLHALSAWLQRGTDWAAELAASLGAPPAIREELPLQPDPPVPMPGQPPQQWLARARSQPPEHWLEHIRRASAGQPVEIHAHALDGLGLAAASSPPGGAAPLGTVMSPAQPGSTAGLPAYPTLLALPAGALPVPPGAAHLVLHLAGAPGPATAGSHPEVGLGTDDRGRQPGSAGIQVNAAHNAPHQSGQPAAESLRIGSGQAEQPRGDELLAAYPAIQKHQAKPTLRAGSALGWPAPALPEQAALSFMPGELGGIPAPSALQPQSPAPGGVAVNPGSAYHNLPRLPASPVWPDLLPLQAPLARPGSRSDEPASGQPAASKAVQGASGIPPASSGEALPLPDSRWPELLPCVLESEADDVALAVTRQQLERRQRLDQEQRGASWNT
jgi:hypothetical protein